MNIQVKDLITLSDKNEYVVVNKVQYEDENYYYIVDINNNQNLKFCYINNDELIVVKDRQLIMRLIYLIGINAGFV